MLTGIGFAAMLFGVMALAGETINTRQEAVWGLAAFACLSLAPALGLPPQPPGVVVADLHQRQLWWAGTVIATAIGVWLIAAKKRSWVPRICGVVCLLLSHIVGATVASGENSVPDQLVRRFTIRIGLDQRRILAPNRLAWRLHLQPQLCRAPWTRLLLPTHES